jgi:hypothetical protein
MKFKNPEEMSKYLSDKVNNFYYDIQRELLQDGFDRVGAILLISLLITKNFFLLHEDLKCGKYGEEFLTSLQNMISGHLKIMEDMYVEKEFH